MINTEFKVGDKVKVSPVAHGLGEYLEGRVSKIERFAGWDFVSVDYLKPAPNGDRCIVVNNLGLIEKI